jgi:transcriptional regulator with XRE-family HTH domain
MQAESLSGTNILMASPTRAIEGGGRSTADADRQAKITLGKRIRAAREAAGLSQHQLALRLNITAGAVGQWELGLVAPKQVTLMKLPQILEVSHEELMGNRSTGANRHMATLTQKEYRLVTSFRRLSTSEQDMTLRQMEALADSKK